MKITLITVGKIKEKFFQDAIAEYSKRLSRYCKLEIIQVADEKTPDGASEAVETQIKEKEGERILSNIKDGSFVVALAINGNMLDSEELAAKMGCVRDQSDRVYHRRIVGSFKPGPGTGRLQAELFKDDIPAPAHAGHSSGADLPELPDHSGRTLP